jgi:hypothetical protein
VATSLAIIPHREDLFGLWDPLPLRLDGSLTIFNQNRILDLLVNDEDVANEVTVDLRPSQS